MVFKIRPVSLIALLAIVPSSYAKAAIERTLTEDFSSMNYYDSATTTGLWNVVDRRLQAQAFAGGNSSRPISFGDGSDGALESSNGATFDTDTHPNGFNFTSVNITGGTITVRGSSPLIIRSLGSINVVPGISVKGGDGTTGVQGGTELTGPNGGQPVASLSAGGAGGNANLAATQGSDGKDYLGLDYPGGGSHTGGSGSNVSATSANVAAFLGALPGTDFDVAGNFVAGPGGGGGGGHYDPVDGLHATGGSGGAGGGSLRITAVGPITIQGNLDARGGNGGGASNTDNSCANAGGGGWGGTVWLQSLNTINVSNPLIAGGAWGTGLDAHGDPNCHTDPTTGADGFSRADSPTRPAWAVAADTYFDTANTAPNRSYVFQSKSYPLDIMNAKFETAPVITQTLNSGTLSVLFAGSVDNQTFSEFTSDITTLSNKQFRYLKWKAVMQTGSIAGPSPLIQKIEIKYTDLGYETVDLRLSAGCGSLTRTPSNGQRNALKQEFALFSFFFVGLWLLSRRYRGVMVP